MSAETRLLVDSFYEIQNLRIQQSNRRAMLARDYQITEDVSDELHEMIGSRLVLAEKDIEKRVRRMIRPHPLFKLWIGPHVKGVAEMLAGGLISGIGDIGRFDTVSKLWKYCGVGINEDGEIQKRKRGQKINFSPFLKTTCWKIGESFVKVSDRGYYGQMLATYKHREEQKLLREGYTILPQADISKATNKENLFSQGHLHNRAKRKTVKLFLSHLWAVWREIEGLPVTAPFIVERDPSHHYYAPPGWESTVDFSDIETVTDMQPKESM